MNERNRSIFARCVNHCWVLFKGIVLAALVCVAAIGVYFYLHVDDEIRNQVQATFAENYPQLAVSVRSARRLEGKGIEIRGLSISDPRRQGPGANLVAIYEIFLHCRTSLHEMVQGELNVSHITVRGMALRAERRPDGSWNVADLLPLPTLGKTAPSTTIENGRIQMVDPTKGSPGTLSLRDINVKLSVKPPTSPPDGAASGHGEPVFDIEGQLAGDHFQQIQLRGQIDPRSGKWTAQGTVEQLDITPELLDALPGDISGRLAQLRPLRCRATLDFELSGGAASGGLDRFVVSGRLWQGRIDDPRLPFPLTAVEAQVHCDSAGVRIDHLSARSGPTVLGLSLRRDSLAADSPMVLRAHVKRLNLDHHLLAALPAKLRAQWHKFEPSGPVDADLKLAFDGKRWNTELVVNCLNVSFTYHKFPYRLDGGTGLVRLKDDMVDFKLQAVAGSQPVRIDGRVEHPGPQLTGWVELETAGPVPLDEKLMIALKHHNRKVYEFVRSLHARGKIGCSARFEKQDSRAPVMQRQVNIRLYDCSLEYDKFPYPLRRVQGMLELVDRNWTFRQLEGRNDSGLVTCNGWWKPAPQGGQIELHFTCTDIALKEELREALTPEARKVWADLRPRGSIDHLDIVMRHTTGDAKPSLDIHAQKWAASQNIEGRGITIDPVWFPYRMEQLTGAVRYRDGQVELRNLRARHGSVNLSAVGTGNLSGQEGWRVHLARLTADRLRADRDLISALPPGLAGAIDPLNLTGPINLHGSVTFQKSRKLGPGIVSNWNLGLDLEDGSLDCGVKLEHIRGGLRLMGDSTRGRFYSRGELAIDSLVYKDVQLTELMGPLWIDQDRVVMGSGTAARPDGRTARHITGKVYGGSLHGDAQIWLGGQRRFDLQATLSDADLVKLAQATLPGLRNITGKAHAVVRLSGTTEALHTLRGEGHVRLRDADIYELPLMVSLLKILSIREVDTTAFTDSDIDFRVEGDHIYLDRIDLNGDAISLKGSGQVGLDRKLDLDFYTLVGREKYQIPFLRPLLGEASRQLLLIKITGTADNPQTTRTVLPGINETLQQLFPEEIRGQPARQAARP